MRILIVDDDKIALDLLENALNKVGYEITTAESGDEAVDKLKFGNYDLLITDLVMEGLDGIGVLKEAKKIDPEISVIVLTGHGNLESAIDALRLSADDYLLKPCNFDELFLRISYCHKTREMRKKIKLYEDILPICSVCKEIRDDTGKNPGEGKWMSIETYITKKTGVLMSHTLCHECGKNFFKIPLSTF